MEFNKLQLIWLKIKAFFGALFAFIVHTLKVFFRLNIPIGRVRINSRPVVIIVLMALLILELIPKSSNAASSFQANFNSGSYDANFSIGSGTGSTDTALPSLNASGYGGTNSLEYAYDGTSTLKYATASNLPADKGSIEMKFQKSAYGDATNFDVGSMYKPQGVGYDTANGYIYSVDRGNNRIIRTKIDGTDWATFGNYGTGTGQFNGPNDLAYDDATGYLYVADACNGRIVKTKFDGTGWTTLGGFQTDSCNYSGWWYHVNFYKIFYDASSDYIYYTNRYGGGTYFTKTKITGEGRTTLAFGGGSNKTPLFGLYYDSASQYFYYIADDFKLYKSQVDGTGYTDLGATGLNMPGGVFYDATSGYVYVANSYGNNLIRIKNDGTGQSSLAGFSFPTNIYYDSSNSMLYVSNSSANNIVKTQFDGTGWTAYGSYYNNLLKFNSSQGMAFDSSTGFYYVADSSNHRIVKTKVDGTGWQALGGPASGTGVGQFNSPQSIAYNSSTGYIYVADRANNRIVKTKIDGTGWTTYSLAGLTFNIYLNETTGHVFFDKYQDGQQFNILRVDGNLENLYTYTFPYYVATSYGYEKSFYYDNTNGLVYFTGVGGAGVGGDQICRMNFSDGTNKECFGSTGSGTGQFTNVKAIWVDVASGFIYAVDNNNSRIVKTNWGASDWTTYGASGSGVGQFSFGDYFWVSKQIRYDSSTGYIHVSDPGNNRIIRTKIDGTGWQTTNDFTSKEKILFSAQATDDMRIVYDVLSRKIRFYLAYSNKIQFVETDTLNLTDGNWYTVKAHFNKANHTLSIDLDGTEVATRTYDSDWGSLSYGTSFYIGARNGSTTDRWDGMIDDINVDIEAVDSTDPTGPTSTRVYSSAAKTTEFTSDNWGNAATPYITWSGASDADSGLKGYYLYFGTANDAEPNTTSGVLTPSEGSRLFQNHVGADGAEQNVTVPASSLTSGVTYYFRARTQDNDLNSTDAATLFTYKYDGEAPDPPELINISPVGCSTQSSFTLSWDAVTKGNSGIAGYDYKNGSAGTITDAGNVTTLAVNSYQEGDNVAYVRTKDNAGNTSSWQTAVYCSTGVSHIITGPTVSTGPSSMIVSWVSSKATTGFVKVYTGNTYVSQQGDNTTTNDHNVTVVGLKSETPYRYQLTWMDASGNAGFTDWYNTTTAATPRVVDLSAQLVSPTQAIVSWNTNYSASGVELSYGIGNYNSSVSLGGPATSFSQTLSGLEGGATYQVGVKASTSDSTEFSGGITFSLPPLPSISGVTFSSVSSSSSVVSWTTNVPTNSVVYYGVKDGAMAQVSDSGKNTNHQMTLNNLIDSTVYTLYIEGTDQFGNTAKSDSNSFTTAIDTTPPTISGLTIQGSNVGLDNQDKAQIAVSWQTNKPASSQVQYGEGLSGENYTGQSADDKTLNTTHLVIINGLTPTQAYHLIAVSADKNGNIAKSADQPAIPGQVPHSILQTILQTLGKIFGWVKIF